MDSNCISIVGGGVTACCQVNTVCTLPKYVIFYSNMIIWLSGKTKLGNKIGNICRPVKAEFRLFEVQLRGVGLHYFTTIHAPSPGCTFQSRLIHNDKTPDVKYIILHVCILCYVSSLTHYHFTLISMISKYRKHFASFHTL